MGTSGSGLSTTSCTSKMFPRTTASLGLDQEKDLGTACCREIVVKITLPDEEFKNLDLDVTKTRLTVQSRKHILPLPLPYPVDHKNGNAKWDAKKSMLSVTLPLMREELGGGR